MDPYITPSVQQLNVSTNLVERALAGLDQEALLKRAGGDSSPMLWILGHVINGRSLLLNLAGTEHKLPWEDLFSRGSAVGGPSTYPALEELLGAWRETTASLLARLEQLTDEELSAETPRSFPVPDKTLRGAINFLAYHEAYHVGQMAYVRKWLGQGQVVG